MQRGATVFFRLILTSCVCFALPGCKELSELGGGVAGSGTLKTEAREVSGFTDLEISGAFTVDVTVGAAHSVQLSGDDNLLPLVVTEVRGNRLVVSTQKSYNAKNSLKLTVVTPELTLVKLSGAVSLEARGISNDSLRVESSGAGTIKLAGKTGRLELEGSGASKIEAADLVADTVMVQISGAGKAEVNAARSLSARISGAAKVRYRGDPKELTKEVTGAGSVEPMK